MIDRYSITASAEEVRRRFQAEVPQHYKARYNATPTQLLPVITAEGPRGLSTFYWGRPETMAGNKSLSEKLINTRVENLLERPTLAASLLKQRCIIPADGFYAWKKAGKKTAIPHRFITQEGLFSMAGVWEEFETNEGETVHTFSIITTLANSLVNSVTERMPVILDKESEEVWLSKTGDLVLLMGQLVTYPAEKMSSYTVSPRIADSKFDSPLLIRPMPPADQHGNLTLFD
jgi:putative SOS response-associated peptidase YedK